MHIYAKIETFDKFMNKEELGKVRGAFREATGNWMNQGKLAYSGVFANKRGGVFIFDVKDSEELFTLVSPVLDYVKIDTQPLVSIDTLGNFFQNNPL